MTEPLPAGNEIWLEGGSTLTVTHVGTEPLPASFGSGSELTVRGHARPAASAIPIKAGDQNKVTQARIYEVPLQRLGRSHGHRLDHVAHEAGAVPVGIIGLGAACRIHRLDHQLARTRGRNAQGHLPLSEAVFAMIRPEPGLLPATAGIGGEQYFGERGVTAESDAPHNRSFSDFQGGAVLHVGEE